MPTACAHPHSAVEHALKTDWNLLQRVDVAGRWSSLSSNSLPGAHGGIDGTTDVLVWDGLLTVLLVVAYVTCRGWRKVDRAPPAAVAELAAQS